MSLIDDPTHAAVLTAVTGTDRAAFVARLQLILRQWPSADRLARSMGVSPSAFRKWLKGDAEPSRERLIALAKTAGVPIAWLISGEGSVPAVGPAPPEVVVATSHRDHFVHLPHRPTAAAAGAGTPPMPEWAAGSEYLALRRDWLRGSIGVDPLQVGLEVAIGDSMEPTIRPDDLLLLDMTDKAFSQFGIYVIEVAEERLVKRVQRKLDGSVVLISDNTRYERDHLSSTQAAAMKVIGRVVWVGGRI